MRNHLSERTSVRANNLTLVMRPRHKLPPVVQPFIGREDERAHILARLRDPACRLLTITGPGGVGKTRLALEVAHALLPTGDSPPAFGDGVVFVPLAALEAPGTSTDGPAAAVADVLDLDLNGTADLAAQLAGAIGDRPMLLILDNCEHLAALPSFVAELLLNAPEITLLATSRGRLGLRGESVLALAGLPTPPARGGEHGSTASFAATELFVASARAVVPDFALTPATAAAVAQICRQVEGLPLGIELAASWTPVLSCGEIAQEIAQNIDFLAAEIHDLPARQQSLRAVFHSSWALLTAAEQRTARRLAVFHGDCSREAAVAVANADLSGLSGLVKKSLVRRLNDDAAGSARYALHGPLRPYAAEQLAAAGETETTTRRHGHYYLDWLATQEDAIRGANQQATLAALAAEFAEVRAAWQWAIRTGDSDRLAAAAEALFLFCTMRSRFRDGAELLTHAAEALNEQTAGLAVGRLLARGGWCVFLLGRIEEARALIERSLALLRSLPDPVELVTPLNYLASLSRHAGAYPAALELAAEGLRLSTAANNPYGMAITLTTLSQTSAAMERYEDARRYAEQSVAVERGLGNRWGWGFNLITLGQIARAQGDPQEACLHFQEALISRSQLGDTRGVALCLNELGDTALDLGEQGVAGWCYEQSFELFHAIGNLGGEVAALRRLGRLADRQAQAAAAAHLYSEALRRADEIGLPHEAHALNAALARFPPGASGVRPVRLSVRQTIAEVLHPSAAAQNTDAKPAPAAPRRSATPAHSALTARELEVLRLVATGLSDAQVAERLVLSTRTVSSYLSSIYGKLQVRSRSAATRWAITHGLA